MLHKRIVVPVTNLEEILRQDLPEPETLKEHQQKQSAAVSFLQVALSRAPTVDGDHAAPPQSKMVANAKAKGNQKHITSLHVQEVFASAASRTAA